MPYKNIAVIGAGTIGTPIAKALVQEGANVVVFTRPASSSGKDLPEAIKVVAVDFEDVSALSAAIKENNVEVVISTVGSAGLEGQTILGDAAKKGGAKLFVPSEFGFATIGATKGVFAVKEKVANHLKSIGLPAIRVFTGLFIPFIPWVLNVDSGKIQIIGTGDVKATYTHPNDIAGFVAYVLTHLPASELEDKVFRIQGESASLNEIAAYYGTKHPVEHVEEISSDAFKNLLQGVIASGVGGTVPEGTDSSNGLWAGHAWTGIKEGLGL
ncbi:hypothetical protein HWV62_36841 [Athelia sp. TMB]|nr:hypothetical protein HWV62_36841 [Athelia sp. TMB]